MNSTDRCLFVLHFRFYALCRDSISTLNLPQTPSPPTTTPSLPATTTTTAGVPSVDEPISLAVYPTQDSPPPSTHPVVLPPKQELSEATPALAASVSPSKESYPRPPHLPPAPVHTGQSSYYATLPLSAIAPQAPLSPTFVSYSTRPEAKGLPNQPPTPPLSPPHLPLPLVSSYARSLYPIPPLPVDEARKAALKQRRKGANPSAAGSSSGTTAGTTGGIVVSAPADLFKWQATVNANPLSALVKGAKKCLGTSDWEVSFILQFSGFLSTLR